jgi:hypothetical protein
MVAPVFDAADRWRSVDLKMGMPGVEPGFTPEKGSTPSAVAGLDFAFYR